MAWLFLTLPQGPVHTAYDPYRSCPPACYQPSSSNQPANFQSESPPTWSPSKSPPFLLIVLRQHTALWRFFGTGSATASCATCSSTLVRTGAWCLQFPPITLHTFSIYGFSSHYRFIPRRPDTGVSSSVLEVLRGRFFSIPFTCVFLHQQRGSWDLITTTRSHEITAHAHTTPHTS
jgi:hypothetical protein